MSGKSASVVNKSYGTVSSRQKCQHQVLAKVIKNETNRDVFDCDLVSNSSTLYLPIKQEFFKRAHELKNARIANFIDVETLIKKYDSLLRHHRLDILKRLHDRDRQKFINSIKIIQSVASKYLCCMPQKLPLLIQGKEAEVSLSQQQIACILANIFFFNEPYKIDKKFENDYPYLNFRRLFISERQSSDNLKCEKLKFIFSYFNQLNDPILNGVITFRRQGIRKEGIDWANSNKNMTEVKFSSGKIEEGISKGYNEVHFANEMIGGGVLGQGAVQGEIRFLMSPELIVSRIFTQKLSPTEAVVITGAQVFSIGEGYSKNFRFKQKYSDRSQLDDFNRRSSQIIAIDALCFDAKDKTRQFQEKYVDRELNKAFAGFKRTSDSGDTIASGKWGCGNFNGDPHLKCFIQILAAAEANRNLVIYTFGDDKLCDEMKSVYQQLREKNVTTGKLYKILLEYSKHSNGANIGQFVKKIVHDLKKATETQVSDTCGDRSRILIDLWDDDMQPQEKLKVNLNSGEKYPPQFENRDRSQYLNLNAAIGKYENEDQARDVNGDQNLNRNFYSKGSPQYIYQGRVQDEIGCLFPSRALNIDAINGRYGNQERAQEKSRYENRNRHLFLDINSGEYRNKEREEVGCLYPSRNLNLDVASGGYENQQRIQRKSSHDNLSKNLFLDFLDINSGKYRNEERVQEEARYENSNRNFYPGINTEGYRNERFQDEMRSERIYQNQRNSYPNAASLIYESKSPVQDKSSYPISSRMEYPDLGSEGYVNPKEVQKKSEYGDMIVYQNKSRSEYLNEERIQNESNYQNQNRNAYPNVRNNVDERRSRIQSGSDYQNPSRSEYQGIDSGKFENEDLA